ncbi:hypothetical protein [Xenorhabdus ishibashii]|uniref:Rhs element Vgr family protein n=1 Tax=Xenorhabdus ishibashii TaxID=1034471 RepID=A0A2D0KIS6_9GAMM|nr:hypothetical protein [Xenorhabdus ishibashii]PHM63339.1 Rhs element Vgr family protein [Xenorhabdus ishibashii]
MKSGLRFTCRIAGVPEDTFAVGEFSLQEGLSELFTLNLTLVRTGNTRRDVSHHPITTRSTTKHDEYYR